ncbi:MAG TPA: hypothetical protein VGD41_04580, partial [Pyrinomonadaceae bacterium]
ANTSQLLGQRICADSHGSHRQKQSARMSVNPLTFNAETPLASLAEASAGSSFNRPRSFSILIP